MNLVRGAWRLLVGVKDALVLLVLLLFFGLLYAGLRSRPATTSISPGALHLKLDGTIVEQPAPVGFGDAAAGSVARQHRLRDVIAAIDAGADDARVKAIALDLDGFMGGGQVALGDVGEALDRFKKSGKPVLAFATGYTDDSYRLAAHANRIFVDPMGLVLVQGPGGSRLYYKGLIDRLGINAHVYRVGKFKSFVEPFERTEASPEAEAAATALGGALWDNWLSSVQRARPKARVAAFAADPITATRGASSLVEAAGRFGLIDEISSRADYERAVSEIAGAGTRGETFAAIKLPAYIAAKPYQSGDGAVGIATVAGNIVDGRANAGTAGGDTIAQLIERGVASGTLKALVLRVDSPGGSAIASDRIRAALLNAKAKALPVVVSMGNVAASGGYWVATAGDRIFAEPATITGSIGVFGIIPTFEGALAKIGVTSDGIATTPLSGQPDIVGGTNPAFDALVQKSVEGTYDRFIGLVSKARKLPTTRVLEIAEGRVWDGGSARQLGLVDQFGGLDEAVAEAARRAGLDPKARHAVWLEKPKSWWERAAESWAGTGDGGEDGATDALSTLTAQRVAALGTAIGDARMLATGSAIQARCLECPVVTAAPVRPERLLDLIIAWIAK